MAFKTIAIAPTMPPGEAAHVLVQALLGSPEIVRAVIMDLTGEAPRKLSEAVALVHDNGGTFKARLPITEIGYTTHVHFMISPEEGEGYLLRRQLERNFKVTPNDVYDFVIMTPGLD